MADYTIFDPYGQPIRRADVGGEPQTSQIAQIKQEFELHPVRGLTPAKLSALLEGAERGDIAQQSDLFADMEEKDGHLAAEMGKRQRAVLTLDWSITPPRNPTPQEEGDAAYVEEVLRDYPDLDDVLLGLTDAVGKGFACAEIEWGRYGSERLPTSVTPRPQRWFCLDTATRSEIRLRNGHSLDGETLNPFGWVVHRHQGRNGTLAREGIYRTLAWLFLFKNYSVRDLAEFLEICGLPLRLGRYESGASPAEKATLLRAVVNIGHAAAGIIPKGMEIEFKEAAKGGADPFLAMVGWCERTQSKVILGGVATSEATNTGLGSNTASVHNEVRRDLLVSDARQIAGTLTRDLIYPILALNRGSSDLRRCPRFVFDTSEAEDLALYSEAVPKLVQVGMKIPARWAHDKLRIPEAQDGEAVLSVASTPQPPVGGEVSARATLTGLKQNLPRPDELIADRLARQGHEAVGVWMAQIELLLGEAESLEELRGKLLAAGPGLGLDTLASTLAEAGQAAAAAGIFDVVEGSSD
ncbi:MAG: hypothetical protein COX57_02165 [Alphaproteobacteria bacterium CG_4_10_14_0_2_um_filter_63_37]|nr:MAG: hypothetical protein AUJ55_06670 [Proteobacteria bacterium CG1_02_64_396]PJA25666.1 MAG: hypothetical protein COX57_02165 [Alphaproteobacteria bacterium CG_4_10_14_0_2_um_filter_63_37]